MCIRVCAVQIYLQMSSRPTLCSMGSLEEREVLTHTLSHSSIKTDEHLLLAVAMATLSNQLEALNYGSGFLLHYILHVHAHIHDHTHSHSASHPCQPLSSFQYSDDSQGNYIIWRNDADSKV